MQHDKTIARRLALLVAALMSLAPGHAAAAALGIEAALDDDGALLVTYTPPPGVRRLLRIDRQPGALAFWQTQVRALDDCARFDDAAITLRDDPACTQARFRVQPTLMHRAASYEAAYPVGVTGVMAYTSFYAAGAPGHGLAWRWRAPAGGYVVQEGRVAREGVQWQAGEPVVEAALAQLASGEGESLWRDLGATQYVYLGRAPLLQAAGATLVRDPALDDARVASIDATLSHAMRRLTQVYGRAPTGPAAVVASVIDLPGFQGDTSDRRMMGLRLPRDPGQPADPLLIPFFVSHEAAHWWNAGVFHSDMAQPWLHEGHADWVALLLVAEQGLLSGPALQQRVEAAIDRCLAVRGDRAAATIPPGYGHGDDPYACGMSLMMLAEFERAAASPAASPRDPLSAIASLHRADATLDARAFARWADARDEGPMHRLLLDASAPFDRTLLVRLAELGIADAVTATDDPLPPNARRLVARELMAKLMQADCNGGMDFWSNDAGFHLGNRLRCATLRADGDVRAVAAVAPLEAPMAAWRAVEAACAAGRPIVIAYLDGAPSQMACPTALGPTPRPRLVQLRPGALARIGLGNDASVKAARSISADRSR